MAARRAISRHRKILIASGLGAAVAVLMMMAAGTDEPDLKVFKHDVFAALDAETGEHRGLA